MVNSKYFYIVNVDGKEIYKHENTKPVVLENLRIF